MYRKKHLFILLSVIWALSESPNAMATPAQVIEKERFTCDWATARQEQVAEIPHGLLKAISLAETGRWHEEHGESFAWPWTVTSGGPGKYFRTKVEAIRYVRKLQAKGTTNIDVGCMQINMHYHGENFKNLSEAFDPDANAAYAASFIKSLYDRTGSWDQAAGRYHSGTPKRLKYYLSKVDKLWNQHFSRAGEETTSFDQVSVTETVVLSNQAATPVTPATASGYFDPGIVFEDAEQNQKEASLDGKNLDIDIQASGKLRPRVPIDQHRTTLMNNGLAGKSIKTGHPTGASDQLAMLRAGDDRVVSFGTAAAMDRARVKALAKRDLNAKIAASKEDRFSKRRMAQLRNWRMQQAHQ